MHTSKQKTKKPSVIELLPTTFQAPLEACISHTYKNTTQKRKRDERDLGAKAAGVSNRWGPSIGRSEPLIWLIHPITDMGAAQKYINRKILAVQQTQLKSKRQKN